MTPDKWEDTKEEVCTHLEIGFNKGETELDTMTRLVCIERQKHTALCVALETIQAVSTRALERERGLTAKKATLLKWSTPNTAESSPITAAE